MILGITGHYASGKDTVGALLQDKGFHHISLSDFIREEAKKSNIKDTRENLINLGNEMRAKQGNSILARLALQRMEQDKNYVITSVRNPTEVEALRMRKDFVLIRVGVPIEVRFERLKRRKKINSEDNALKTVDDLRESEQSEMSSDPTKQQLHKVRELADMTLDNSKGFSELKENVDKLLRSLSYTQL